MPLRVRYKGFNSIEEAASHTDFKHMVPFEADEDVRAMPGGVEFTRPPAAPAAPTDSGATKKRLRTTSTPPPPPLLASSDAVTVDKKKKKKQKKRQATGTGAGAGAGAVPLATHWGDLADFKSPIVPSQLQQLQQLQQTEPEPEPTSAVELHVATDGSVLGDNGAPGACGGIGFAWQWGDDVASRGSCWEPLHWNHRGTFMIPPHTNVSAEWQALSRAMTAVLLKTRHVGVRRRIQLHVYIDCSAVVSWLNKALPLATQEPHTVDTAETNWVLKSQTLALIKTVMMPEFAGVELHWVRAHRSAKQVGAIGSAQERYAAELNNMADAAAKEAASAFTQAYLVSNKPVTL